ncbi:aminotransferase class I/II-fold pyridoxal phosphate-dependent enzyme [Eudoraea chungangensis]|uniref:aminotransferase class I/II-fold pyridoxal phosphate-dependent enzyme n=1 Tax=Eudoraea chungangensis TaxID=1481905 RepID=UPI0023EC758A|nr:aminotransferase class I/II-fold pyridoxal phosphate-dependent enzyme [Eudoraea chungangensis]
MNISIDSFPGRKITYNLKTFLYFGGTAYLGVQTDVFFQKKYIANLQKYGTNYGASRISNIKITLYEKAEEMLATWTGAEKAMTVSSGYLAGQLLSAFYASTKYRLYYLPGTHSALIRGKIDSYKTIHYLNETLRSQLKLDPYRTPVVFLDSIDFNGSNYPNFESLKLLPLHKCVLIVDDSHGMGIIGLNGAGIYKKIYSYNPKELLVSCSLGKALGIDGGAIFGNKSTLQALRHTATFTGASPAAAAALATLTESISLYEKKRIRLQRNIKLFLKGIKQKDHFTYIEDFPAYSFTNESLVSYLATHGIIVSHFEYPDASNSLKSRIVLSASHKKKDISQLCHCINEYFEQEHN